MKYKIYFFSLTVIILAGLAQMGCDPLPPRNSDHSIRDHPYGPHPIQLPSRPSRKEPDRAFLYTPL